MKRLVILLILSIITSWQIHSQELIIEELDFDENLNILDLTQRNDGALWFITDHKLYSYDGHELELKSTSTSPKDRFVKIFPHHNSLFVGTKNGCILKYNKDSLIEILKIKGRITDMIKLNDQEFLISSNGDGLYRYSISTHTTIKVYNDEQLNLTNDIQLINDAIFIATDRGLFRSNLALDSVSNIQSVGNKIIKNLSFKGDSLLWLSEFKSYIHRLNIKNNKTQSFLVNNGSRINHITHTKSRLFISTKQGLFHSELLMLNKYHKPSINPIWDSKEPTNKTFIDDEGNLWIGANTNLFKSTVLFSKWNIALNDEIHALLYQNENIYIGTDQGLYYKQFYGQNPLVNLDHVNVTCIDAYESHIAVGTYVNGLTIYKIDEKGGHPVFMETIPFDNSILALKYLSEDSLVIATLSGVKIMTKTGSHWGISKEINELSPYYILSIHKTDDKTLWFGTDKKGILKYQNNTLVKFEKTTEGKSIKSVYSITQDYAGVIWASSSKQGLIKETSEGFSKIVYEQSDMGAVTSVTMTRDSLLLLIGIKNVALMNPASNNLTVYNDELSLKANESFLNNYCLIDSKIIFEHHGQLYQFNKDEIKRSHALTTLKNVQVNLETIDTTIHQFSEHENNFSFEYNGILMRNPSEVFYSYKLEGFDENWRFTKDRSITYPHLIPGDYNFILRSSHQNIDEGSQISYDFTIKRAIYKRWWFILSALLIISWIVFLWSRKNRREKEIRNQLILQKTQTQLSNLKSQLNPHFLFNSFNTVIGLIEEDKDRSIEFIEHLTDFFRLVLETGEDELIPIESELKLIEAYKHLLTERFPVGLDISIVKPFKKTFVPPLSIQLLVENAVKHNIISFEHPLDIIIQEEDEHIVVQNNFNPKTVSEPSIGIGLSNLRSRYMIIANKEIIVSQKEGKMTIKLPLIHSNSDKK